MITITQITSNNESKLMGEIDDFSYCISYNKSVYDKLQKLSAQIDTCTEFEDWQNIILEAKALVSDKPLALENSKYFIKINDKFFLTNGEKYYNIVDSNNIIKSTLNYYNDKGLSIDRFAPFIVRGGSTKLLTINNIYHKLNLNGNIRAEIYGDYTMANRSYRIEKKKVIINELDRNRYFINGSELKSNTEYTLKELGSNLKSIKFSETEEREGFMHKTTIPVLIKPDLSCYLGDFEQQGLILDPDQETDWDAYVLSFIDKHGSKH